MFLLWGTSLLYLCNENQLDALFIRSLFRQSTSTCFGHICSPSSGWPANRQSTKKHNTCQLLYVYSTLPDDGLQICPKHVQVDWWNKLMVNSASSWFSLNGCIEMHGQQNVKFLVMFLYKACWGSFWTEKCSSLVTTYCYTNIVVFGGGLCELFWNETGYSLWK